MKKISIRLNGFQTTINREFEVKGISDFTDGKVSLKYLPAFPDTGILFKTSEGKIEASYRNFRSSKLHSHTTEISKGDARVTTVEHLLSSFYGLGVDNVVVKMNGASEIPIFDSSSLVFAQKIVDSGIKKLKKKRKVLKINKPIIIKSRDNFSSAVIIPSSSFKVRAIIDFNGAIGKQTYLVDLTMAENYLKEIAPARSFFIEPFNPKSWKVLRKKFKMLPENPVLSNIIVYTEKKFITKLRYENEPVRHKISDFLGDLSLLGHRVMGEFILYRPGHSFNNEIVKRLAKEL